MSSTADSQSFVNESIAYPTAATANTESASDDDQIGDLNPVTAGSLYPSKKMKMEEEKKEDEKMEEVEKEERTVDEEEELDDTGPCTHCARLESMELTLKPEDDFYGCKPEYYDNEHQMLRLIYYLRSVDESGGFYVDCPPPGFFGGIYNPSHFPFMRFNEKAEISAKHAIAEYNEKKTKKLEFVRMINATGSPLGYYRNFYLTFEALDLEMGATDIYQAVVCYDNDKKAVDEVLVFRRDGEDLLEPDSSYDETTKPKCKRKPENSGICV